MEETLAIGVGFNRVRAKVETKLSIIPVLEMTLCCNTGQLLEDGNIEFVVQFALGIGSKADA